MYTMKLMGMKRQFHHGDFMTIQREYGDIRVDLGSGYIMG